MQINLKMATNKNLTISLLFLASIIITITIPTKTTAFSLSHNSGMHMMHSSEVPYNILGQTPVPIPNKGSQNHAPVHADWKVTPNEYVILVEIPGAKREDVKFKLGENRVLKVSGERKVEEEIEGESWVWAERHSGHFKKHFPLPGNADLENIRAEMKDGVLRIIVPKVHEEVKRPSKVISIGG